MSYKRACLLYKTHFGEEFPEYLYNVEEVFAIDMIRQCLDLNCTAEIIFPIFF